MLLDGAIGWAVGRVADAAGKRLKALLSNSAARKELVEIGERAVEAAIQIAPELASDLRSEAYLHNVLAPSILAVLEDPTETLNPAAAAEAFITRFVAPYVRGREIDDVLSRVFQLEPERLRDAFSALIAALRSGLYRSEYWREPIGAVALEEVRMGVLGLQQQLAPRNAPTVDLARARQDAKVGSEGLRSWSQTIAGIHLNRPELGQLRERIRSHPSATTLVTGPAGAGKSALLAELTSALEHDGMTVFAVKADLLPDSVKNLTEVGQALGMGGDLITEIEALSRAGPMVLIIDQLDAVSEVMDRTSRRMQLLLQLANRWPRDNSKAGPNVHVVVSSRPFEAKHDARFQSLRAQEVALGLPEWTAVAVLLQDLGLAPESVPEALREALRRPFLLKLFVEIARRGESTSSLVEGELLNSWLRTAPLGDKSDRNEVLGLLKTLALEMTATETLWRPSDRYDQDLPDAVRRAEACELIVRKGSLLGFAHQSWLDDFQARAFTTGRSLAEHAWSTQDGLFGRATILRALERLRAFEPAAYADAIDALLGDRRTRRHLRHLTVDLIAAQAAPIHREVGWVIRLILEDPILARRSIGKLVSHWAGWRSVLKPQIATLSANPDMARSAVIMVEAEAKIDAAEAERLLLAHWKDPEHDQQAFEICWRGQLWSARICARLAEAFARAQYDEYAIADYASDLAANGRSADAAHLIGNYLASLPAEARSRVRLHEVEKVVDGAPETFFEAVLPCFLETIELGATRNSGARDRYPQSASLPFDWRDGDVQGNVFAALQRALSACAQRSPETFDRLVEHLDAVELDEAQGMIAEAYASAGSALADEAAAWLLADRRRLSVGTAHVQDEHNVGHTLQDYSTRELLTSVTPYLTAARLDQVRDAIEAWAPYGEEARTEPKAEDRRRWLRWAEESRISLLALLPAIALTPRRRRQVEESLATQPRILPGRGIGMASIVPSPMSAEAMAHASDDDLFRMIDEVNDSAEHRVRRGRGRRLEGGVSQLSQSFAAFGKAVPTRAMNLLLARFQPGRHEHAAGALIHELAGVEEVSPKDLLDLIWTLQRRGFSSDSWRQDVARAMERIAERAGGLGDEEIVLLETWISADPGVIADRIARREHLAELNRERNRHKESRRSDPILFGRGLGGGMIMPQGNYRYLAAMAAGVLHRDPADAEAWLSILERHVDRPEDPHIWATLTLFHGTALYSADCRRVVALFEALWARFPDAFEPTTAPTLWRCRQMLPPVVRRNVVQAWLEASDPLANQLAGEFCSAGAIVDSEDAEAKQLADALLSGPEGPAQTGAVYAAAAAWRDTDPEVRRAGHTILLPIASHATGPIAEAVSTAVDTQRSLPPDELTRELLVRVVANRALLSACLNTRFLDAIQELLLYPGFEDLVLKLGEATLGITLEGQRGRSIFLDGDLVGIAIALQRASSDRRVRAMNLYERLLDAGAYGADKAAQASLRR